MDEYLRHQRIWRSLWPFTTALLRLKFNITHEDLHVDGPVLLVPNHVSAWDPLLVSASLREKQVYFVASEHIFRLGPVSRVINYLVAPIPRRKASSGADTVKACLRHLRAGHSVCLFAEGEQSWAGRNIPIFSATGKLARSSGATLVTYRLEGAYLSLPRWGKNIRRGRVYGHPVGIYPPDVLKAMSPDEINAAINRDIAEDAWERQRLDPVAYRGKNRAEGLERALWLCPRCCRIGTLRSGRNRIFCSCGLDLEYTKTGFFQPPEPFADLAEWDDWQCRKLRSREFPYREQDGLLFSDENLSLSRLSSGHQEQLLAEGSLLQYEDRLECAGYRFPLVKIANMAMILTDRLLFSADETYYEIRSSHGANLRKYLEIWKEQH
ncbi:MAG: 1-acyl-sn-glycerol-3-phosphate acyltransferase [Oscillospiraceae bacterium]|nr:1-acyl-sn-glycerol-3-phosphate acyltransferase [Oscillospiraceae bacterium]